jgi:hypothetical protein
LGARERGEGEKGGEKEGKMGRHGGSEQDVEHTPRAHENVRDYAANSGPSE